MKLYWFKVKRVSNLFLLLVMILGMILSVSSSKIFFIFLGMEIKMFGVVPFIVLKSEKSEGKMNVGIYYFLVQVFGSMLFLWGSLMNLSILGIVGFAMKMGVSPFFWWVPSIFKSMDWFSMILMSTVQKIPSFMMMREVFDFNKSLGLFGALSGLLVSVVGMKYSNKKMKLIMAWSSVANMSMVFFLMMLSSQAAFMYFLCYCGAVFIMGMILMYNTLEKVKFWSSVSNKSDLLKSLGVCLLIFSGLPPLLGFQWKVYFFSAMKKSEVSFITSELKNLLAKYVMEYPIHQHLGGWSLGILISGLLILQIVAYIKVFMNMYSSYKKSLEGSSRFQSSGLSLDYFMIFVLLLSLLFLVV